MWPMGISSVFSEALIVPLHSPNSRLMPAVKTLKQSPKITPIITGPAIWENTVTFCFSQANRGRG